MQTFKLSKPFALANGEEISEFQLEFESMSTADFRQVSRLEAMVSDSGTVALDDALKGKALSFKFQLASGFLAATKGTPGLQVGDFSRLPMKDALELAQVAIFFWLGVVSEQ